MDGVCRQCSVAAVECSPRRVELDSSAVNPFATIGVEPLRARQSNEAGSGVGLRRAGHLRRGRAVTAVDEQ